MKQEIELQVVNRSPAELKPHPTNAKLHPDEQLARIASSIREYGFNDPIAIDENDVIIEGHGRWEAVLRHLATDYPTVPTITLAHLTDAQKRAYRLAHNKLTMNSDFDIELLKAELALLAEADSLDLETGFTDKEIDELLAEQKNDDEDKVPPIPKSPTTRLGDLWQLGSHRLVCGDSTDGEVVARLLGDVVPVIMVTDPPYGVDYHPQWREDVGKGSKNNQVLSGDTQIDWSGAYRHFRGPVMYIWFANLNAPGVADSITQTGFQLRSHIVWRKDRPIISRGHYHWEHEGCFYAVRKGKTASWHGDRKQTTVWDIPLEQNTEHPTQKPVECMRRPIRNHTSTGQAVYDPFVGSGTTIVASDLTQRVCYAVELEPAFCDVSILRWQQLTEADAIHVETGKTFNQLAAERKAETTS